VHENLNWQLVSEIGGVASVVAWLTWWIGEQFRKNREVFYRVMSLHNREDDDRFEELSNDIWRIHLRNAMRDGAEPPQRKAMPRRRYLTEDAQQRGVQT